MIGRPSADLLVHLRQASLPLDDSAAAELRRALYRYVDEQREAGRAIDHVIVAVKRIASEAGIRPSAGISRAADVLAPMDQLLIDLVFWAVNRYVTPPASRPETATAPRGRHV
jgi:hypothetical protein